jgi:hypothetical protein
VLANLATVAGSLTNLPPLPGRVVLSNGDSFRAEVIGADRKQVQLRTQYSGALTVERACIASLRPGAPAEGVLDTGPLERWAGTGGERQPRNHYQREFKLPPRFSLAFEAVGEPQNWGMVVWLGMKLLPKTRYAVDLRPDGLSLQALLLGAGNSVVSVNPVQAQVPGLSRRGAVHVTCLVDRPKNEVYVLLDGKLATKFIGGRGQKAPDGNSIQFVLHTQPPMQVRDIVLAEWKGTAEALSAALPAGDQVRLHDQTLLAGAIEALRDGVVVRTGQPPVALGRVGTIHFDPANAVRARRTSNDVRVTLVNGDHLTLNAPRLDERGLTGTVEGIGPVNLAVEAVRRLDFQP